MSDPARPFSFADQAQACLDAITLFELPDPLIENQLTAAADTLSALEWRPIATAPLDPDTKIEVFCPGMGVYFPAHWNTDAYAKTPRPYWTHLGEYLWGKLRVRENQPTHWRPAADPPIMVQEYLCGCGYVFEERLGAYGCANCNGQHRARLRVKT